MTRCFWTMAAISTVGALLAASHAQAAGSDSERLAHGKALVELNCSRCHGVGESDESAHPEAPEFRTLAERYPVDALEEAFAEGIVTGHPDMPEFEATPQQIEDIIAYLASIQRN